MNSPHISPLGDSALLLQWGNAMDAAVNRSIAAFAASLALAPMPGFIEAIPAYSSLAVYYDLQKVRILEEEGAYSTIAAALTHRWMSFIQTENHTPARLMRIPVLYDGEDLEAVGQWSGLDRETIIRLHSSRIYRVYMMGFLPGFAYMGEVDERIAAPRHISPRLQVRAGSVGIAGRQTGIYPIASPGGWQIIGHTTIQLFNPQSPEPCLLRNGDEVEFYEVGESC